MSWSSKSIDFITLFTEDLERSKAFYQDVFGLRLIFEDKNSAVFRFANTGINLLRPEAAGELIRPGAVAGRHGDVAAWRAFPVSARPGRSRCRPGVAAHVPAPVGQGGGNPRTRLGLAVFRWSA